MNERIKSLYVDVVANSENMRWNIEDAEKFAELIIRECIGLLGSESEYGKNLIKKHFGVE